MRTRTKLQFLLLLGGVIISKYVWIPDMIVIWYDMTVESGWSHLETGQQYCATADRSPCNSKRQLAEWFLSSTWLIHLSISFRHRLVISVVCATVVSCVDPWQMDKPPTHTLKKPIGCQSSKHGQISQSWLSMSPLTQRQVLHGQLFDALRSGKYIFLNCPQQLVIACLQSVYHVNTTIILILISLSPYPPNTWPSQFVHLLKGWCILSTINERKSVPIPLLQEMGVSKYRGETPKMDSENNGKPYSKWMIWGDTPLFLVQHPNVQSHQACAIPKFQVDTAFTGGGEKSVGGGFWAIGKFPRYW